MTLIEAATEANRRGLIPYYGFREGEQNIVYELGFLEPGETCNVGLRIDHPEHGVMRWVSMGRGSSWDAAFKDVDSRIN